MSAQMKDFGSHRVLGVHSHSQGETPKWAVAARREAVQALGFGMHEAAERSLWKRGRAHRGLTFGCPIYCCSYEPINVS